MVGIDTKYARMLITAGNVDILVDCLLSKDDNLTWNPRIASTKYNSYSTGHQNLDSRSCYTLVL